MPEKSGIIFLEVDILVIINEHWATSGRKVYELEEVVSGQRTTWSPPQKLDKARYREALIHVATQFEAAAQQTQDANAVPEVSLGDKEADETTPFGVYATQVFMPRKIPFIAENTRDGWERYLRLRIIPAFGQLAIGSISSGRLTDFLIGMQTQGLAQQTVERYYSEALRDTIQSIQTNVNITNESLNTLSVLLSDTVSLQRQGMENQQKFNDLMLEDIELTAENIILRLQTQKFEAALKQQSPTPAKEEREP